MQHTPQKPPLNATGSAAGPLLFGLGGIAGAAFTAFLLRASAPEQDPDLRTYATVRGLIEDEFVRPTDRGELLAEAMDAMAGSLDPYSRYYVGERLSRVRQETLGTFLGLGAIFEQPMDGGRLLFPMPGSPAAKAGLRVGDELLAFDGVRLADLEPGGFAELLGELEPRTIDVEVRRLDGTIEELELTPATVLDPTVRHADLLGDGVGYVAVTSFSRETPGELDLAVRELQDRGAQSLILDLRGNPGGVLTAALEVTNRFVPAGVLLITETREGHLEEEAYPELATLADLPLVVLVDEDSASASEVVAGALQDHRRAAIVGTETYGKGTIQTLTPLGDPDGMLKITTGFYQTPSGRSIDRHYRGDGSSAIWPDVEVELLASERRALHAHLGRYSPAYQDAQEVDALERELGREPRERVLRDAQLEAALTLLAGSKPQ